MQAEIQRPPREIADPLAELLALRKGLRLILDEVRAKGEYNQDHHTMLEKLCDDVPADETLAKEIANYREAGRIADNLNEMYLQYAADTKRLWSQMRGHLKFARAAGATTSKKSAQAAAAVPTKDFPPHPADQVKDSKES